jgi:chromosome segregation protein
MRLQKLEVYGFKSFADKTSFEFENGLTAFVGPNGCGKSNVVDAVRWALGEQRPKALRGSEMADVIFKGNGQGRRSLGVAEVTITVSSSRATGRAGGPSASRKSPSPCPTNTAPFPSSTTRSR